MAAAGVEEEAEEADEVEGEGEEEEDGDEDEDEGWGEETDEADEELCNKPSSPSSLGSTRPFRSKPLQW